MNSICFISRTLKPLIILIVLLSSTLLTFSNNTSQANAQGQKYIIRNVATEKCLDTGNQNQGLPYQFDCNANNPAQQWTLEGNSAGGNTLRNVGGGACLDHANSGDPGFRVYLFNCYNGSGQAFNVDVTDSLGGILVANLRSRTTGLALDGFGNNPYLYPFSSGNDYQDWFLIPAN